MIAKLAANSFWFAHSVFLNLKEPVPCLLPAYRCSSQLCCLISISRNQCHAYRCSSSLCCLISISRNQCHAYRCNSSLCCLTSISRNQCHAYRCNSSLCCFISISRNQCHAYRCSSSLCCLVSISRNQCHAFFPPIDAALNYVVSFQSQETSVMSSTRLSMQLFTILS